MELKNKKVLITGADGFIGSHLTEMLVRKGCKVKALCQYNSFNNWGWLETINCKDIEIVTGDIRDPHFCLKITDGMDVLFHLAALIAIPYSYVAPGSYVNTNVNGTLNICQAALSKGCEKIIHTSTSEVYGTAQYVPIDEKHPLQPQSPYSASKIGADMMAMSFYNTFHIPLSIARPFNTYGPRQSARAIIPTVITQIASGLKQIKIGDLTPTRDFNFVEDTCEGFIAIAESDKLNGQVVNIGSGLEYPIGETVNLIKDIMKSNVEFITEKERLRPEKSEVFRLLCDNTKIKKETGWKSRYSLRDGLKLTIDWFLNKENLKQYKTDIYNV